MQPAKVPLHTNCRNTKVILEKVQSALGADMGMRGAGAGPKVREHRAASQEEATKYLAEEIERIINHGGLTPDIVTILSPNPMEASCVADLPVSISSKIAVLDEYSVRSEDRGKIGFARIKDFKGLENDAIILVDLLPPNSENGDVAEHYVAMSRAKSVLSIIYKTDDGVR